MEHTLNYRNYLVVDSKQLTLYAYSQCHTSLFTFFTFRKWFGKWQSSASQTTSTQQYFLFQKLKLYHLFFWLLYAMPLSRTEKSQAFFSGNIYCRRPTRFSYFCKKEQSVVFHECRREIKSLTYPVYTLENQPGLTLPRLL